MPGSISYLIFISGGAIFSQTEVNPAHVKRRKSGSCDAWICKREISTWPLNWTFTLRCSLHKNFMNRICSGITLNLLLLLFLGCAHRMPRNPVAPQKAHGTIKIGVPELSRFPQISFPVFTRNADDLPLLRLAPPYCDSCKFWRPAQEFHPLFPAMNPPEFSVTEHQPDLPENSEIKIHYFRHYVVLVLDVSASMSGAPLQQAKTAAIDFIQRSDAEIAIISFNSATFEIRDFTQNEDSLIQSIKSLTSGGGTRLYNALHTAIEMLQTKTGFRHIVALTDGETGGDDYSLDDIIQQTTAATIDLSSAQQSNIDIFPVGFRFDSDNLRELARATSGRFYQTRERQSLMEIFRNLADSLRSQFFYELRFRSHFPQADGLRREFQFWHGDSLLTLPFRAPLSDSLFELAGTIFGEDSATTVPDARIIAKPSHTTTHRETVSAPDGSFSIVLPRFFGQYSFWVEGPMEFFITQLDTFLDLRSEYYLKKNFYLSRLRKDATLILWTIYFPNNEYELSAVSLPNLNILAGYFQRHQEIQFEISGHTDESGTQVHNQWLSEMRARAVRDYFISCGILAANIRAVGFGEARPLLPNTTAENRRMNRRVEIRLTRIGAK